MGKSIDCIRVNHINVVIEDYDAGLAHVRRVFGSESMLDASRAGWAACLVDIGRVIIEYFSPEVFLLNSRYGPHYLGMEYQADMDQVRDVIRAHGIRIAWDIGTALFTHPADCLGVSFEFYGKSFHDQPVLGGRMKSPAYWRDEHPLGLTGLKAYSIAVADIDAASAFLQGFLGAAFTYEAARPAVAARAIGFQIADSMVELLTPVGDGALRRYLERFGQGIYSTTFGTADIDRARRYFAKQGIDLVPGAAPGALAIPAEANLGVIFEFSE